MLSLDISFGAVLVSVIALNNKEPEYRNGRIDAMDYVDPRHPLIPTRKSTILDSSDTLRTRMKRHWHTLYGDRQIDLSIFSNECNAMQEKGYAVPAEFAGLIYGHHMSATLLQDLVGSFRL